MSHTVRPDAVAIVGIGCRFPGGTDTPEKFWALLRDGVDAITTVPRDRFDVDAYFDADPAKPGKMNTRWGGYIGAIDTFDADFFGISPREAARIDPQQRLLLEVAWEALEDGGQNPAALAGTRTGVFVGICSHDYGDILSRPARRHLIDSHVTSGSSSSVAANRISFFFDFRGPSLAVDTACSSSLTAVHLACRSLAAGECDLGIAGGVNVLLAPEPTISIGKAGMLSPDGRCKAFDARANGYVRGEGAGAVVLKPLARAVADGDRIYAVIRGTAVNQDGRTTSMTVPSRDAQESMLREALRDAAIEPAAVQYVEAHGTGTPVGDPIEVSAIGAVLSTNRPADAPCLLGSVKTNIGHLEAASGVAGLIKTALALHRREIPATLHFRDANPAIPFDDLRLRVATAHQSWPPCDRAVAAVNSFGFGGSNAHAILEGPPAAVGRPRAGGHASQILVISARSEAALRQLAEGYRDLVLRTSPSLPDLCYTASVRRSHHDFRVAVVADSREALVNNLDAYLGGDTRADVAAGRRARGAEPKLAFVFSGMGPQWWGMGRQLMKTEPVFRDVLGQCDQLLRPLSRWSLMDELLKGEADSRVGEADLAQVTNLAIQVALTALWRSWGIDPDAVVGHSAGEIAAAHAAGALTLSDGLLVAFHRGRLQSRTAGKGRMLAVGLSLEAATEAIARFERCVSVAAVNSPASVTLSGDADALEQLAASFDRQQIFCRFLQVTIPYHGPQMELIRNDLLEALRGIHPQPPAIPLISSTLGRWVDGQPLDAGYWWQNIRQPVRFAAAIDQLIADGYGLFVEIGPHPVLAASIAECAAARGTPVAVCPTLRRTEDERVVMLRSVGTLYARGRQARWPAVCPDGNCITLPVYPWQRERHWFESSAVDASGPHAVEGTDTAHPLLGRRLRSVHPAWETNLRDSRLAYLADHVVRGGVVYPAAAYVEMALAAAAEMGTDGRPSVDHIAFRRPLSLDAREETILQLLYDPGELSFEIHSAAKGPQPSWTLHSTGTLRTQQTASAGVPVDLDAIRQRCAREIPIDEAYQDLEAIGLQYRGAFRGITELWQGDDEALGRIGLPASNDTNGDPYLVHPALLDAAFQVLVAAMSPAGAHASPTGGFYLPVSIDRVDLHATPGKRFWSHATIRNREATAFEGAITLVDDNGNVALSVDGLRCKLVDGARPARLEEMDDCLYQLRWDSRPLQQPSAPQREPLRSPLQVLDSIHAMDGRLIDEWNLTKYDLSVETRLNAIVSHYIVAALAKLGWDAGRDGLASADVMADALGVIPRQRRFFARLLEIVRSIEGERVRPGSDGLIATHRLRDAVLADYPEGSVFLDMLSRCGDYLAEILHGEMDVRELLFSPDARAAWEKFFGCPWYTFYNGIVAEAIATAIEDVPHDAPLRILEVGAGTGGTTASVLPRIRAGSTEYGFTDISPFFLAQARQHFSEEPRLNFQVLDIESDPLAQGFAPQSFDVVLAANVLHATASLRNTLGNVRRLLAPGGLLVLLEGTRAVPFVDLIFGVTEGWWRFTDHDVRPSHPILSVDRWRTLLQEAGFEEACGFAVNSESVESVQSVILSRAPVVAETRGDHPDVPAKRRWLMFADQTGIGESLAGSLRAQGDDCVLVLAGTGYMRRDGGTFEVAAGEAGDIGRLLEQVEAGGRTLDGVLHLWSLDAPPSAGLTASALMDCQRFSCETVVSLLQAYETRGRAVPDLWLITAGSQPFDDRPDALNVSQAPLWGLGRVLLNEQPHLRSRLVDLGPACTAQEIEALLREIRGDDFEEEIAFRGDQRFARRMHRTSLARGAKPEDNRPLSPEREAFRLEIASPGSLETLKLHAMPDVALNPDDVLIRVMAAAPNFRDVMLAFGMLPPAAFRGATDKPLLGIECSGVVIECGRDVTEFRPGDEVIAMATGTFGSRTRTRSQLVARKPAHLTFEEATTIPAVFVTAHYAFHHLAKLAPGERVLIHSATGGVGLAAVQLARRAGAVIFATAGSPEKRAYLESLGIEHVMDSRSLAFADEILRRTDGEGVDVVLNSLTGDAIPKGLSILRPYGRFVEIGKRDIYENSTVGLLVFNKNLSFFSVALDRLCVERPAFAGEMLREIVVQLSDRVVEPLPHTDFDLSEAEQAFRFFAQARHIGKVVLSVREPYYEAVSRTDQAVIRPDATYLITGGLGGFGLAVADWLVRQGARHLVLMSRSATPIKENEAAANALQEGPARVVMARGDVCDEQDVARVLEEVRRTMAPLRGVIHAAAVFDDAPIAQLDHRRLRAVLAPKAAGGWNLHTHTLHDDLDFFVLFSSTASVFGNAAQGNYAAANAFLDALAPHRHALGLPALTINWGWLSGIGYISRHGALDAHLARQGLSDFSPEEALAILDQLLRRRFAQVSAIRQDWDKWSALDQTAAVVKKSKRLSNFDRSKASAESARTQEEGTPVLQSLRGASPANRLALLSDYMVRKVAKVLGSSPDRIDPQRPLAEMGFDSLMAVELQVVLGLDLKVQVAVVKLLQGISISQLAASILDQLGLHAASAAPAPAQDAASRVPLEIEPPAAAREVSPVPPVTSAPIAAPVPTLVDLGHEPADVTAGVDRGSLSRGGEYYRSLDYSRWSLLQRVVRKTIVACLRLVVSIQIDGLEHVPPTGPFLLATNHLSMLDAPLMWPFLPRRTVIFAAERWKSTPLVNKAFDFVDAIYVRRGEGDRDALDTGLAVLRAGGALGLAPEGAISTNGGLAAGRTGVAYLARESGVPIVPLVLYGQEKISRNLKRLRRTPVRLHVGPPITLPSGERTASKLREDTQHVMTSLAAMLPPSYRGVYTSDARQR